MITRVDEPIKVGVVFGSGRKIKPVWFVWNKRYYRIRETTYSWMSREGNTAVYNFSVTDGNSLYEICYNAYNAEVLKWKLMAVETE